MMAKWVPGREEDDPKDFYCVEDDCSQTIRADSLPAPTCPLHGLEMEQGTKPLARG